MKLSAIAELLQGTLTGDGSIEISALSKIEEGKPGTISFLANPKYENYLYETQASAVIIAKDQTLTGAVNAALLRVDNPYLAFTQLLEQFSNDDKAPKITESQAFVDPAAVLTGNNYIGAFSYISAGAQIGFNTNIYPQVFIGRNVQVGHNCVLYPGVKVYDDCIIGDNCILHAGAVIGSDGFGFAPQADGSFKKIPQTGNVILEDDVEIGANTTIDRATMGSTIIRKGAKLDNLIQIAHNVEIGAHSAMAAQSGVSGSTKLGKHNMVGGQVGFAGHLNIADRSQFGAQSGINSNIEEPGKKWFGSPHAEYREAFKSVVIFRNLPQLQKRVDELERLVAELTKHQ